MHDQESARLHQRLHDAVDHRPIEVPDLVPKAQAARTRRILGAVTVTGAVAVAGALSLGAVVSPMMQQVTPAQPAATSSPNSPTPTTLSDAEITKRCATQLSSYDGLPHYEEVAGQKPSTWAPAYSDRDYRVGDVVGFASDQPGQYAIRYCVVPEVGQSLDVKTLLTPSAQRPDLIVGLCSESQFVRVSDITEKFQRLSYEGFADLRGSEVIVLDESNGVASAVVERDGERFACYAVSPFWDSGSRGVTPLPPTERTVIPLNGGVWRSGSAGKSITPDIGVMVQDAGVAPKGAVSLSVGGIKVDVKNGAYAIAQRDDTALDEHEHPFLFTDEAGNTIS